MPRIRDVRKMMRRSRLRCCKPCQRWGNELIDLLIDIPSLSLYDACVAVMIDLQTARHYDCPYYRARLDQINPKIHGRAKEEPHWVSELLDLLSYYPHITMGEAADKLNIPVNRIYSRKFKNKEFALELDLLMEIKREQKPSLSQSLDLDIGSSTLEL